VTLSQKLWAIQPEDELSYPPIDVARAEETPAVRAVDEILSAAIAARASDVHIEPYAEGGRVRERVDGVLRDARRLGRDTFERVLSRLKLLAGMDIADKRVPQEGRYCTRLRGRSVEARVSSMPTVSGEKLAIRLLEPEGSIPRLEELGMPSALALRYRELVHAPSGFLVVCGPTGSGKTTTLYASMMERNVAGQQLCTVEDPVEIRLPGVAQLQVNVRAGVTFAAALRSFMRQDPNVIMVGEMRDADTASVACAAALCGQLVLTTMHGNDSLHALDRLSELGVSRRSVAASLTAVVSQRLVRQLCPHCKIAAPAPAGAERFGIPEGTAIARPSACERCAGSGYLGRSAVFEMAVMTPALRDAVEAGAPLRRRRAAATGGGYESMQRGALELVRKGETSLEEIVRVLGGSVE
jgi:type IV pilus assembly protein PilB